MASVVVLGTGGMGTAIARRLLATGHQVTAWNRTRDRAAPLAGAGAGIAATPAEAAAQGQVVITMLTDAAAVEAALFDTAAGGAVAGLGPGAVVVQMSTIAPDEVRRIAARLPEGVRLLDAPVGGSVDAAAAGTLTILASGEPAAMATAAPVLDDLGTIRHCGLLGAAAARKLVLNTAMLTALGALHDTLAVAEAIGVDPSLALDTLAAGPLAGAVSRATATGASFAISLAAKDLRLALHEVAGPVPVAAATADLLRRADPEADLATLITKELP